MMDDMCVFSEKEIIPSEKELQIHLGESHVLWKDIHDYVLEEYPKGNTEWNFPGKKYGWSYRIKDKRRAIIYFLPREGYFKVAFVFGQKAFDVIMNSDIDENIKQELRDARKYAEGRGIRIDVNDEAVLHDIKQLVDIKLAH